MDMAHLNSNQASQTYSLILVELTWALLMSGPGMKNICDYSFVGMLKNGLKGYPLMSHICQNQLSKHSFSLFFRASSQRPNSGSS
jgi:hypothetical protein